MGTARAAIESARHKAEILLVRGLSRLFRIPPWDWAVEAGAWLGSLAQVLFRSRWRLTLRNLEAALPEKDGSARKEIAREVWRNLGRMAVEFARSESISREELLERARFENLDILDESMKKGKGVIIHTGHFSNWETIGVALSALGYPLVIVAKSIKNPHIDRWINNIRQRFGLKLILHKNPFFPAVRALKEGKTLGILMDQNVPSGGVSVPFFGRNVPTTTLTALLAIKLGCPIVMFRARREKGVLVGKLSGVVALPATAGPPGPEKDLERKTFDLVSHLTSEMEKWARENPEDWFWVHNRWKRAGEAYQ